MWTRHHRKRRSGALIVPAVASAVIGYFAFHAYHGEYGIYSKYLYEGQISELQMKLASIQAERLDVERRVQLLRDGSLERDMLDEQARRTLNFSRSDELTIMRN